MRKIHIKIEVVPVEVAQKILKRQQALAKRNGNRKLAVKKLRIVPRRPRAVSQKLEVQTL